MISEAYNKDEGFEEFANETLFPPSHNNTTNDEFLQKYDGKLVVSRVRVHVPVHTYSPEMKKISGQSKLHSLYESLVNVTIGYFVAMAAQLLIFPLYDIHISLTSNFEIGGWMMIISIIRSYILRRLFNNATIKH